MLGLSTFRRRGRFFCFFGYAVTFMSLFKPCRTLICVMPTIIRPPVTSYSKMAMAIGKRKKRRKRRKRRCEYVSSSWYRLKSKRFFIALFWNTSRFKQSVRHCAENKAYLKTYFIVWLKEISNHMVGVCLRACWSWTSPSLSHLSLSHLPRSSLSFSVSIFFSLSHLSFSLFLSLSISLSHTLKGSPIIIISRFLLTISDHSRFARLETLCTLNTVLNLRIETPSPWVTPSRNNLKTRCVCHFTITIIERKRESLSRMIILRRRIRARTLTCTHA